MSGLPRGWTEAPLSVIVEINPLADKKSIPLDAYVNFVPMPAIEAETGEIDISEVRPFAKVKSGYTPFQAGDVLFAKITPCMENGKMAVVPELPCGLGFGSTEFHVFRSPEGVLPKFVYYRVSSLRFRYDAEHNMTGAVGQKRVPQTYLASFPFSLPPINEQRRIVEKIEQLFDLLDRGEASLRAARDKAGLYRQSLLRHAFEGHLTADWRTANPDKLEAPESLLTRIQNERDSRYERALDEWQAALAKWRAEGENGKKPAKPKRPTWPKTWDFSKLSDLPASWQYIPFEAIAYSIKNGISAKPDEVGPLKIFRISAVRAMAFDLSDFRRITDDKGEMEAYLLQFGDLVFTRYNGSRDYVGVSAMYRGDGSHVYPDKLIRCEIRSHILNPAFLEKVTNSGETRRFIEERIRTTAGQSGISGGDIKSMPVPICSPAEQAEIVSRLEAKLSTLDALEADIDTQLARSRALRQSILKRAFEGKIVPQDPTDEPASVLLERIKAERVAAPKAKRIRKVKA